MTAYDADALQARIADLEAENENLRASLSVHEEIVGRLSTELEEVKMRLQAIKEHSDCPHY